MSEDKAMLNILQNLNNVGTSNPNVNPTTGEQSAAPKNNDSKAMMNILSAFDKVAPKDPSAQLVAEGLDSNQKKAGQADATFKSKNISPVLDSPEKDHPTKGKFVGEEEENEDEVVEDVVTAEKSPSLVDILRSMDETEEDIKDRLSKEFHTKETNKKPKPFAKKAVDNELVGEAGIDYRLKSKTGSTQDLIRDLKQALGKDKVAKLQVKRSNLHGGDLISYAFESAEASKNVVAETGSVHALKREIFSQLRELGNFVKSSNDYDLLSECYNELLEVTYSIGAPQQMDEWMVEAIALLNDFSVLNEDFDWEPQPEFAGAAVKQDDRHRSERDIADKIQKMWVMLLKQYKEYPDAKRRRDSLQQIKKVAGVAGRKGIELDPAPQAIGLKGF